MFIFVINNNTTGATNGSGPVSFPGYLSSLPVLSGNQADQSGVVCVHCLVDHC